MVLYVVAHSDLHLVEQMVFDMAVKMDELMAAYLVS
jgi:chromosome condensin MukBEF complex kleisin-like MukF subunit